MSTNQVYSHSRTTDTQLRHKSKLSEKLGQCGRQNMFRPYLKFGSRSEFFCHAVKAISSLGVRSVTAVVNLRFHQSKYFLSDWLFISFFFPIGGEPSINFFKMKFH